MSASEGRTLHGVTPPGPGRGGVAAGELLYGLIGLTAGPDDRTLVIGASEDRRVASALGAPSPLLSPWPHAGADWFIGRLLARAARAAGAARVMLWSRELLGASVAARRAGLGVEATLLDGPGGTPTDPWRAPRRGPAALDRLRAGDGATAEAWREAGARGAAAQELPEVMPRRTREEARRRLGLEGERVLAPLSADPGRVDARALMFVSGVLEILGHRHALLLPERAERLASALNFRARTSLRMPLVLAEGPWLEALPAADIFLRGVGAGGRARGDGVTRRLHAIADRLGVPVAVTAGWTDAPGLGHRSLPADIRENLGGVLTLMGGAPAPVEAA